MGVNVMGSSPVADARGLGSDFRDDSRSPVGVELLHYAQTLCASVNHRQLEDRFIGGFGCLFDLPMYGLYTLDPWTGGIQRVAAVGVGDTFLDRYEREGREVDLVDAQVRTTRRAVYNMAAVASMDEWLENPLYTKVAYLHDIRHVIQAPVLNRDGLVGMLHCATSDPTRAFTPYEVRLTAALASVVGTAIEGINARGGLERERDQAVVALERTGTPVVIIDPAAPEPRLNDAARSLLVKVTDPELSLHRALARPGTRESFSHHVEVELVDGGTGLLHGQSSYTRGEGGALITVLELQRDQCAISEETLTALTPREREVALLVIDGCSDREISERLYLSHHTVSQYVKRIYRKLDVTSRVALTRLLVDLRDSRMRD